jgi:hypothetical protein
MVWAFCPYLALMKPVEPLLYLIEPSRHAKLAPQLGQG